MDLNDRRLARIIKQWQELPGHELFQYIGDDGERYSIGSADVNGYLRDITGADFSSKDFRTWAGTVLAARALVDMDGAESDAQVKKNIAHAVELVAEKLGNTKAVRRKCYVHPAVLQSLHREFIAQAVTAEKKTETRIQARADQRRNSRVEASQRKNATQGSFGE